MSKNKLMQKASLTFNKVGFQLKKHSPEILVVAGVVGTVASAVMACRATTKVSAIMDKAREDIDTIHDCANSPEFAEDYTQEDCKRDLTITYAKTGFELVKLYAPSVLLGVASLTSIIASHHILHKRYVGAAAAYAAVNQSFKTYRGRVVERFGEAVDRELRYNVKAKEIEETVIDEKTGKEKKVKNTVEVVGPEIANPYAVFFDETCGAWEKDAEYNKMFLCAEQNWANDRLRARGYLFLNEVYERLGVNPTAAGQHIGWIYAPEIEGHKGDNYVDFGMSDVYREGTRRFVNGLERSILLDLNPDGDIYELMNTPKYCGKFCK